MHPAKIISMLRSTPTLSSWNDTIEQELVSEWHTGTSKMLESDTLMELVHKVERAALRTSYWETSLVMNSEFSLDRFMARLDAANVTLNELHALLKEG